MHKIFIQLLGHQFTLTSISQNHKLYIVNKFNKQKPFFISIFLILSSMNSRHNRSLVRLFENPKSLLSNKKNCFFPLIYLYQNTSIFSIFGTIKYVYVPFYRKQRKNKASEKLKFADPCLSQDTPLFEIQTMPNIKISIKIKSAIELLSKVRFRTFQIIEFQKSNNKSSMKKVIAVMLLGLFTSTVAGNNNIQGNDNLVYGTNNNVAGDSNVQITHSVDVKGSNNRLVGSGYSVKGDNIRMYGVNTNVQTPDALPKNVNNAIEINEVNDNRSIPKSIKQVRGILPSFVNGNPEIIKRLRQLMNFDTYFGNSPTPIKNNPKNSPINGYKNNY